MAIAMAVGAAQRVARARVMVNPSLARLSAAPTGSLGLMAAVPVVALAAHVATAEAVHHVATLSRVPLPWTAVIAATEVASALSASPVKEPTCTRKTAQ